MKETSASPSSDQFNGPEQRPAVTLDDLLPRLDALLKYLELERVQSSQTIALLRGKANNLLWSGTIQLNGASGNWRHDMDFQVPFARVGYIDSQGFGPYLITTDATDAPVGPGSFNTFSDGSDSAVVPIVGRHLSITCASDSDTGPTVFISVFTDSGDTLAS